MTDKYHKKKNEDKMISYKNNSTKQKRNDIVKRERFETIKNKIIDSKGKISHDAVLQLFYDRMNNGEGMEIYGKLTRQ